MSIANQQATAENSQTIHLKGVPEGRGAGCRPSSFDPGPTRRLRPRGPQDPDQKARPEELTADDRSFTGMRDLR